MSLKNPQSLANIILPLVIVLVFITSYSYVYDSKLDLNGDNANYYMLGKSIATGEGFTNVSGINKSPNNHFPPGYPAIISVIITVFNDSIETLKLFNGFFFLFSGLLLFYLIKSITNNQATATIVSIALLLNTHYLRYATIIMTEVPFLLFSLLTIICFIKSDKRTDFWKDPFFYLTLLSFGTAYYIKTSGIALLGAIILYLVINQKWKEVTAYTGAFVVLFIPWFLRSQNLGGNSYMKQLVMINPYRPELGQAELTNYIDRFFANIIRYISKEIPNADFPFITVDYRAEASLGMWVLGLLIITLTLYGIWQIKQYRLLILAYVIGTFGILSLWPDVWVGVRFMLPIVPFILLGLIHGINSILSKLIPNKPITHWAIALIIIGLIPNLSLLHKQSITKYGSNWENYFDLAKWAKSNLDPNTVISCRKPTMFYLYSGTYTSRYKYTEDNNELLDDLEKRQVDYVILDQLGYSSTVRYLYPAISNNPERFSLIKHLESPDTYLLKFNK